MDQTFLLNLGGLILNIIGTIILSFSLSNFYTAIHGAIALHDMTLKGIMKGDNNVLNADVANLLRLGATSGRARTVIGLIVLMMGFILQLTPFVMEVVSK